MKNLRIFFACVASVFVFAGCSNGGLDQKGVLKISLPGASVSRGVASPELAKKFQDEYIHHYQVIVKKDGEEIFSQELDGGEISISNLDPVEHIVTLKIFKQDGTVGGKEFYSQDRSVVISRSKVNRVSFGVPIPKGFEKGYIELPAASLGSREMPVTNFGDLKKAVEGITEMTEFPTAIFVGNDFENSSSESGELGASGIYVQGNVMLVSAGQESSHPVIYLPEMYTGQGENDSEKRGVFTVASDGKLSLKKVDVRCTGVCMVPVFKVLKPSDKEPSGGTLILDEVSITANATTSSATTSIATLIVLEDLTNLEIRNSSVTGYGNSSGRNPDILDAGNRANVTIEGFDITDCGNGSSYSNMYFKGRNEYEKNIPGQGVEVKYVPGGNVYIRDIRFSNCTFDSQSGYGNLAFEDDIHFSGDLILNGRLCSMVREDSTAIRYPVIHRDGKITSDGEKISLYFYSPEVFNYRNYEVICSDDDADPEVKPCQLFELVNKDYTIVEFNRLLRNYNGNSFINYLDGFRLTGYYLEATPNTDNPGLGEMTVDKPLNSDYPETYTFYSDSNNGQFNKVNMNVTVDYFFKLDKNFIHIDGKTSGVPIEIVAAKESNAETKYLIDETSTDKSIYGYNCLSNVSMKGNTGVACIGANGTKWVLEDSVLTNDKDEYNSVGAVYLKQNTEFELRGNSYVSVFCMTETSVDNSMSIAVPRITVSKYFEPLCDENGNIIKMKLVCNGEPLYLENVKESFITMEKRDEGQKQYEITDLFELEIGSSAGNKIYYLGKDGTIECNTIY